MTVKQRQSLLVYLGYLDDDVDGIWGRNSKSACVDFQRDNGLDTDGICGPLTEAALKDCVAHDKLKGTNVKPAQPNVTPSEQPTVKDELTWEGIKYFKPSEFACKCGKYCDGSVDKVDLELVKILDNIREHFGAPITITSGVRCSKHNQAVGGVGNSQHLYGKAADFIVKGVNAHTVYDYCNSIMTGNGGLGKYDSFTHIDTRDYRARW